MLPHFSIVKSESCLINPRLGQKQCGSLSMDLIPNCANVHRLLSFICKDLFFQLALTQKVGGFIKVHVQQNFSRTHTWIATEVSPPDHQHEQEQKLTSSKQKLKLSNKVLSYNQIIKSCDQHQLHYQYLFSIHRSSACQS